MCEDEEVWHAVEGKKVIAVLNKADLPPMIDAGDRGIAAKAASRIAVSALTGSGIDDLKQMLFDEAGASFGNRGAHLLITNVRHKDALVKAEAALCRAGRCAESDDAIAFFAFELRDALRYLGEITGETCAVDVLDEIFSRFCIGK